MLTERDIALAKRLWAAMRETQELAEVLDEPSLRLAAAGLENVYRKRFGSYTPWSLREGTES